MSTSAAKAKAKREEAAKAAAVVSHSTERPLTDEEMEMLGLGPEEGPTEMSSLWRGGRGIKQYYVVAKTEEEAIAKLIEKDSILGAIGCTAEMIDNIDGYTIVAAK